MRTRTVDAVRQDVDVRMIQEWGGMIYWINPTFSIRSKVRIHQQSHSLVPTKLVNSLLFFPLSMKITRWDYFLMYPWNCTHEINGKLSSNRCISCHSIWSFFNPCLINAKCGLGLEIHKRWKTLDAAVAGIEWRRCKTTGSGEACPFTKSGHSNTSSVSLVVYFFVMVRDAHGCECTTDYVWKWEVSFRSQLSPSATRAQGIKLRLLPWRQSLGTVAAKRSLQEVLVKPVFHKFYAAFQMIKSQILFVIF